MNHDDSLWHAAKPLVDLAAVGAAALAFLQHAPQIAAVSSALWMAMRCWETLMRWLGRDPLMRPINGGAGK